MIEFGKTLREARQSKGLAQRDIAERTNMMIQIVQELENEDFHRIAAAIYGRGFVKMYCSVVGLEPQPLVDAFMYLYTGAPASSPTPDSQLPTPNPQPTTHDSLTLNSPTPNSQLPTPNSPTPNSTFFRFLALAIVAIALLACAAFGIKALYKATSSASPASRPAASTPVKEARKAETKTPANESKPKPAAQSKPAKKPKKTIKREEMDIPPLYID